MKAINLRPLIEVHPHRDTRPVNVVLVCGGESVKVLHHTADRLLQMGKRVAIVQYPGYGNDFQNIGMTDCMGDLTLIAQTIASTQLAPDVQFIGHSNGGLALLAILNRPWATRILRRRFGQSSRKGPDLTLINFPISIADKETDEYCRLTWKIVSFPGSGVLRVGAPLARSMIYRAYIKLFPDGHVPTKKMIQDKMRARWTSGVPKQILNESEEFLPNDILVRSAQSYFELLVRAIYAIRRTRLSIEIVDGALDTFVLWPDWANALLKNERIKRTVLEDGTHFIPNSISDAVLRRILNA